MVNNDFRNNYRDITTLAMFQNHLLPLQTENVWKKVKKKLVMKKIFFWKNLIFEKVPSLSQKMMICHKNSMSGVYENVF